MSSLDPLFTSTTVLLTNEYVSKFTTEQLLLKLGKVRKVTGITFSKAKKTYALAGKWDNVNAAFRLLKHWWDNPDDEPPGEFDFGEHETVDENDAKQTGFPAIPPDPPPSPGCKDQPNIYKRLKDIDILKQAIEEGIGSGLLDHENHAKAQIKQKHVSNVESKLQNNHDNVQNESDDELDVEIEELLATDDNNSISNSKPKSNIHKKVVKNKEIAKTSDPALSDLEPASSRRKPEYNKFVEQDKTIGKQDQTLGKVKQKSKQKDAPKSKVLNQEKISKIEKQKDTTVQSSEIKVDGPLQIEPEELDNRRNKKYWSRVKIPDANEKHKCNECGVVLKTRKRLNEHMKRIHIKGFTCTVCERGFGYPTDLGRHKCAGEPDPDGPKTKCGRRKKPKNTTPEYLPCQECEYVGTSKKRINEHIRRRHRLHFKCDACDKAFGFVKDLQRHKENVHTEPAHFCDKCSRFYKSTAVYDMHMKTHEEGYIKPNYACQVCVKSFTTKYVLAAHIKAEHLGMKKTYLCQICGKHFSQHNSYKQHLNAHAGIKPYVCDLCGKSFTYDKSLKEHKFMHDNIRRFQCHICEKAFRQRTTLRIHMKVHQTVKDHHCQTCGRGFSQKQALERHERIHTGLKPYTCTQCQKTFGDSSTIRRHMLAIHHKSEDNWREDIISNVKRKTDYYVQGGTGNNRTYQKPKRQQDVSASKEQVVKKPRRTKNADKLESTSVRQGDPIEQQPKIEETFLANDITVQPTNMFTLQQVPQQSATIPVNYTIAPPHNQQEYVNLPNTQEHMQNQVLVASFQHTQQQPQQQQQQPQQQQEQQTPQTVPDTTRTVQPTLANIGSTNLFPAQTLVTLTPADGQRQTVNVQPPATSEAVLGQLGSVWGFVGYPTYYSHANIAQFPPPQT